MYVVREKTSGTKKGGEVGIVELGRTPDEIEARKIIVAGVEKYPAASVTKRSDKSVQFWVSGVFHSIGWTLEKDDAAPVDKPKRSRKKIETPAPAEEKIAIQIESVGPAEEPVVIVEAKPAKGFAIPAAPEPLVEESAAEDEEASETGGEAAFSVVPVEGAFTVVHTESGRVLEGHKTRSEESAGVSVERANKLWKKRPKTLKTLLGTKLSGVERITVAAVLKLKEQK